MQRRVAVHVMVTAQIGGETAKRGHASCAGGHKRPGALTHASSVWRGNWKTTAEGGSGVGTRFGTVQGARRGVWKREGN